MKKVKLYLHNAQALFVMAMNLVKVLVCGRGFGKSTVLGVELNNLVVALTRGRLLLLGLTYNQILTLTLPPIINMWESLGLYKDIDYVIGKAPPKHWPTTYQQPQKFENIITFSNGTCIQLGSFDRKDHLRGGSFDAIIVDEAALIDKERYNIEILPSLRPSNFKLEGLPRHLSQIFVTSMPWTTKGMWVLDYEKKAREQKEEERKTIELNAEDPSVEIKKAETFFLSGTSWDNVRILGKSTILRWKREMGKLRYLVECMNKRIKNLGNKFYPKLDEDIHYYSDSYNYTYLDNLYRTGIEVPNDCRKDNDLIDSDPLQLSFDFGAFSCCVVGQEDTTVYPIQFNILNSLFTEGNEIIDNLVDKFVNYYQYHGEKTVYLWGDKSGNRRMENSKDTLFEQVQERLNKAGWIVIKKTTTNPLHIDKYNFWNEILSEESEQLPVIRINKNNNKPLIISMENADLRGDKKDKRGEKDRKLDQQYATHLSDAADYLVYHKYNKRGHTLGSFTPIATR